MSLTITTHTTALPDADGWCPGIVRVEHDARGQMTRMTVQCAVCLRTATGRDHGEVVIVGGWHFAPDGEQRTPVEHRRCPDCRAAHRHPAVQLDLLDALEEATR